MTRKDYEMLAICLREERKLWTVDACSTQSERLAVDAALKALAGVEGRITLELQLDNPRFDHDRFAVASGV